VWEGFLRGYGIFHCEKRDARSGCQPIHANFRRERDRWPLFSFKIENMSNAGPLFRPYDKLVKITLGEKQFEVPDGNMLLRAFQFLSPEDISYGKFCWNEECQYCRVTYDLGPDTPNRTAISCKLMVQDGMRVTEVAQEIKYSLRKLGLDLKVKAATK
jgi:hypothetical protein